MFSDGIALPEMAVAADLRVRQYWNVRRGADRAAAQHASGRPTGSELAHLAHPARGSAGGGLHSGL